MIKTALTEKAREHADEIVARMNLSEKDRELMLKKAAEGHPGTCFGLALKGQQFGII